MKRKLLAATVSLIVGVAGTAAAVPVQPGESGVFLPVNAPAVVGELLASADVPFDLAPPGLGGGTFRSAVVREAGGTLAFLYSFPAGTPDPEFFDLQRVRITGFGDFTTDVGQTTDLQFLSAERDLAGALQVSGAGTNALFSFFVRTDAIAFDTGGTMDLYGLSKVNETPGSTQVGGVHQPAAATAIPLPPAVWQAGAVLGAAVVASAGQKLRRRHS